MAAEAESKFFNNGASGGDRDTFLTDLMQDNKKNNSEMKRPQQSKMKAKPGNRDTGSEMNDEDIEDELRDIVFDFEQSKALVLDADNFLTN
jgi:hypothetical protein